MDSENRTPNIASGRQTPISQRRPLRLNFNVAVLSPTKRRKQSHTDDLQALEPVKPGGGAREAREAPRARWSSDDREVGSLLLEVFSRLGVKDLLGLVAPACRLWREVAHSKELWTILRSHVRLVDQLLVVDKVVERRSKGRLFKCKRLGTGEAVLLRMVDLELTNAGKDDGAPTSFLREAALLKKLRHPNIIRHLGAEILGKRAVMCTEYVHESFAAWFRRLERMDGQPARLREIKGNFHQLLTGLSYVHHQGVMHRNLKPDNIFMDAQGVVKIGDFTTPRMLDIPLQAYTPEDPKERDRSGREMRRLWYRAPELIMREEVYGPKVDVWSVGCLLAEAASGRAPFQSDSEIDHLFRVFRMVGTPTLETWPEAVTMKSFSPKFPVFSGFDLAQVTRAACCGRAADLDALLGQALPDRDDTLQHLLKVAPALGIEGMYVLDELLKIPPALRAGADTILDSPFFSTAGVAQEPHPAARVWLSGGKDAAAAAAAARRRGSLRPRPSDDVPAGGPPPVSVPSSVLSADVVWSVLRSMQRHERGGGDAPAGEGRFVRPLRPHVDYEPAQWASLMDFIVGLACSLSLTDYTVHLASRIIDRYLAVEPIPHDRMQVVAATCLKVADVFAEQSKEYYKQENAAEYAEATFQQATAEQMLLCEKELLPKLDFDLHLPTTHWFTQCFLAYARIGPAGAVAKTAYFIGDLTLLDHELLAYLPSLRAQCALVLAVFLTQQAKTEQRRRLGPQPSSAASPSRGASAARSSEAPTAAAAAAASAPGGGGVACSQDSTASIAASPLTEGGDALSLTYLGHWDRHVRDSVCRGNTAIDTAMCLQAVVRTLTVLRREWKSAKLTAVESKHGDVVKNLHYPQRFPVSRLALYILPDSQRGGDRPE